MQLNKVAPIEGEEGAVLGNRKGQLFSIGDAKLSGFVGGQNVNLASAEGANNRGALGIFVQVQPHRISHQSFGCGAGSGFLQSRPIYQPQFLRCTGGSR